MRYFGFQVGGLGSKLEVCEALLESILDLVGVWEAKRQQGRGLEGLGLVQGWLRTRIWAQHGPNLSQLGANLGPTWTQDEQLGPNLGPTWSQLEPTWSQLGSTWPKSTQVSQLEPTWSQLKSPKSIKRTEKAQDANGAIKPLICFSLIF